MTLRNSLVDLRDLRLDVTEAGTGRPIVFLRSAEPPGSSDAAIEALSHYGKVIAPWSPGFGHSNLPQAFDSIEDLAYAHLDLMEHMDLDEVILVGASFGGWVAAEIAVRNTQRIAKVVLADAFGLRVGAPTDRPIADIYALSETEVIERSFGDPRFGTWNAGDMSESDLLGYARSREAQVRFGWDRYMHNPVLGRWLHRIDRPTLVLWGERDRIVSQNIGREFAARIVGARFQTMDGVGHYPHIEKPHEFAEAIAQFAELRAHVARSEDVPKRDRANTQRV